MVKLFVRECLIRQNFYMRLTRDTEGANYSKSFASRLKLLPPATAKSVSRLQLFLDIGVNYDQRRARHVDRWTVHLPRIDGWTLSFFWRIVILNPCTVHDAHAHIDTLTFIQN